MTSHLSTADTPFELRCPAPNPHPHVEHPNCNRLLGLYGKPTIGTISIRCRSCKNTFTFRIRST